MQNQDPRNPPAANPSSYTANPSSYSSDSSGATGSARALRQTSSRRSGWSIWTALVLSLLLSTKLQAQPTVDASTLDHKVMCGYQGWFRCPGDAANLGWAHWSRHHDRIGPNSVTFDAWPDVTEYDEAALHEATGFILPNGQPAKLFTSDHPSTVRLHFQWMRRHAIDGVWLQRFAVDLPGGPESVRDASRMRVLEYVRDAANATGRVWAVTYDISGMPPAKTFDVVTADWQRLVDRRLIADSRYLRHDGKPVVQIWGLMGNSRINGLTAQTAAQMIKFFRDNGCYVVGGGDWAWRANRDAEWRDVYASLDAYAPWNVGNLAIDRETGVKRAATSTWADDIAECKRLGIRWIPVVYPGFRWDNLQRAPRDRTLVPRRKGEFYWEQFHRLRELNVDTAFIAMFDETDESTAIFKLAEHPPTQGNFLDPEATPPDWYLRLTTEAARMIRHERPASASVPITP